MKKIIPILFILCLTFKISHQEEIIIPKDSLRLRVIANSNTLKDQEQKIKVKEIIEQDINKILKNAKTTTEATTLIQNNLQTLRQHVNEITSNNTVNFGENYFPEKKYQGVTYKEGKYKSLVITLGNGLGKNWWCVMFPPLCLLDNKNNTQENIEYKLLIKEILTKYQT